MKTRSSTNNLPSLSVSVYMVGAYPDSSLYLELLLRLRADLRSKRACLKIGFASEEACHFFALSFPDKRMDQMLSFMKFFFDILTKIHLG